MRAAAVAIEESISGGVRDGALRQVLDGLLAAATAAEMLLDPVVADPPAMAGEPERAADLLVGTPSVHASGTQRQRIARSSASVPRPHLRVRRLTLVRSRCSGVGVQQNAKDGSPTGPMLVPLLALGP